MKSEICIFLLLLCVLLLGAPRRSTAHHTLIAMDPIFQPLSSSRYSMFPGPSTRKLASRTKRDFTSTLIPMNLQACASETSCNNIRNLTSWTINNNTTFYIATKSNIWKVDYELQGSCVCTAVVKSDIPVLSVAADDSYIYWFSQDRSEIWYTRMAADHTESGTSSRLPLSQEMLAEYSSHLRASCNIPCYSTNLPKPIKIGGGYATFNITEINAEQHGWFSSAVCILEMNPTIIYSFVYAKYTTDYELLELPQSCLWTSDCLFQSVDHRTPLDDIKLERLSPNSSYAVFLLVSTATSHYVSTTITQGSIFETKCEVSSGVANLKCLGVNETTLEVSWDDPEEKNSRNVRYEVYANATIPIYVFSLKPSGGGSFHYHSSWKVHTEFTLRTFPIGCPDYSDQYSQESVGSCRPFLPPPRLSIEKVTDMQATMSWTSPSDNSVQFVVIQWSFAAGRNTVGWSNSEKINGQTSFTYHVTDLIPYRGYKFRTHQQYVGYTGDDGWRYSEAVTALTNPGVPAYPSEVKVKRRSSWKSYLQWADPDSNGSDLEYYVIEYRNRSSPNDTRMMYSLWETVINISAKFTQWDIANMDTGNWYEFRVSAVNGVGRGDASLPSTAFYLTNRKEKELENPLALIVGVAGGLVAFLFIIILLIVCKRCSKKPEGPQSPQSSEITTIHLSYGTDLQLAQIRHMTELATWKGISNIPQDYMNLLPVFPRDKLTLTDFLGKGAFGEVYRGIAHDVEGNGGLERKVAVKTLREGSTDSEKCEFLMEAYFMSNFNHRNILSLLGVCLDNEPQYLILELMEGGDLLHYVRDARPNPLLGPKLTTGDLLDICLDVAAGCKYLEEQRFIHRDLAARNCLVSTRAFKTDCRIVKIGDFGLARDIYRNDYYHKAGEGLLPVRWMAPESLVDNMYTTQSDVWSFGVLLWEVMTFGQQPYPTLTNIEVLHLVRAGGRLEKPNHCPKDIHALMIKCWHGTPSLRPSFNWATQWLEEFKQRNMYILHDDDYYDDLNNVNYTTITTSEEDLVDHDISPQTSHQSPENRFTAAVIGFRNQAFSPDNQRDSNSGYSSDDDRESAPGAFRHRLPLQQRPTDGGSASTSEISDSYLYIARDPPRNQYSDSQVEPSSSSLHFGAHDETWENPVSSDEALNYSVLGFPPSRNSSVKSNVTTIPKEIARSPVGLASVNESIRVEDDFFLPYIGDLPITDEERLTRKQFWNRQSRLHRQYHTQEDRSDFHAHREDNHDESESSQEISPYLSGVLPVATSRNRNWSNNHNYTISPYMSVGNHLHSSLPSPKHLHQSQRERSSTISIVSGDSMENSVNHNSDHDIDGRDVEDTILQHTDDRDIPPLHVESHRDEEADVEILSYSRYSELVKESDDCPGYSISTNNISFRADVHYDAVDIRTQNLKEGDDESPNSVVNSIRHTYV